MKKYLEEIFYSEKVNLVVEMGYIYSRHTLFWLVNSKENNTPKAQSGILLPKLAMYAFYI